MAKTIDFPTHAVNCTPATIRLAFDHSQTGIVETGYLGNINMSSIYTRIIQDAGRFCEHYASDILYSISTIKTLCECIYPIERPIDEILTFGLRENGSDHNDYIMNHLENSHYNVYPYVYAKPYYRRILAVRVQIDNANPDYPGQPPKVHCELRDISNHFHQLNPADLDENGKVIGTPYPNGNPVPVDLYAKHTDAKKSENAKETKPND